MAYTDDRGMARSPGSIAGTIAIHVAMGAAIVSGLGGGVAEIIERTRTTTFDVPDIPPPPPPPTPKDIKPNPVETNYVQPPIHAPNPPVDLSDKAPLIDITPDIPDVIPDVLPTFVPEIVPSPTASPTSKPKLADPVRAKPRNNPGNWVTHNDYRPRWIKEELSGIASFRLDVGTNGKVQRCTITKSSGHAVLDDATCRLVTSRAKFRPARDQNGDKVSGHYANSVSWRLPD